MQIRCQVCTRGGHSGENIKVSSADKFLMNLAAKIGSLTPSGRRSPSWKLPVIWPQQVKKTSMHRCVYVAEGWRAMFIKTICFWLKADCSLQGHFLCVKPAFCLFQFSLQVSLTLMGCCVHCRKKAKPSVTHAHPLFHTHMTGGRWGVPTPRCCRGMRNKEAEVSLTWVLDSWTQI